MRYSRVGKILAKPYDPREDLEEARVDNWSGYAYAKEIMQDL